VGTLVDLDEGKSPMNIRGLGDTMSHELWNSLEESTNIWIWCLESDFVPFMSWETANSELRQCRSFESRNTLWKDFC